ncbi:MAG: shikimate dehydrogenase family protein, partial [Muribaculaceae bacterium]
MAHPEKLYGLLGYPLVHSFSQNYFNQKFEAENINAEYINFEIPDIGMLMEVVAENENLNGLNVTIPYKEQVIPFLDEIDPAASEVGAVNVIKFIRGKDGLRL